MHRPIVALSALIAVSCGGKDAEQGLTTTTPSPELGIEVTEPPAGAHVPVGPLMVVGSQSGLSDLTLNGDTMEAAGDGSFEVEVQAVRGINAYEARGVKGGTFRMVRRSVLAGSFAEPQGSIDEAIGLRLNQGGLDAVGGLVGGLVDPTALSASLAAANPIYESTLVDLHVVSLGFDPLELDFGPSPGELAVDVVLPQIDMLLLVDLPLFDPIEVTVNADEARVAGVVGLGTDGQGHLTASFSDAWVELDNLDLDTSLLPGDLTFGVEGLLQGTVEDLILEQVEAALPPLLEEQLSTLELAFDLDLLGTPVSIASSFRSASVDTDGVQLVADLDVDVQSNGTKIAPGFLAADAGRPTPDTRADLSMALSDDLVNRLLFEVWTGGLIDQTLTTEDGSLPSAYLEAFGTDEGTLSLDAKLPPVLVQTGDVTELQIGELLMRLDMPTNPDFSYIDLALSAKIPVDLEVVDGELTVALGSPDLDFIVRDTDWAVDNDWLTELLAEELPIESLILVLGNFSFELPSIAGISLTNAAIDRDASGVFTNIGADL